MIQNHSIAGTHANLLVHAPVCWENRIHALLSPPFARKLLLSPHKDLAVLRGIKNYIYVDIGLSSRGCRSRPDKLHA